MIDYVPAQLHKAKSRWYIDYYAYHPGTGNLKRKQIKVNRIKNLRERTKFAKRLVQQLNLKLAEGWSPWIEQESPRSLYRFSDALDDFLADKRELRFDTLRDYSNFVKMFKNWLSDHYTEKDPIILNFTHIHAIRFMEDQYKRGVSSRRYNNLLARMRLLFNWLVEHQYTKTNPFFGIKRRKEKPKTRIMDIEPPMRQKLRDYLRAKNKMYWALCMFAFHSLLRPKEISYIKVKDVDIEAQTIFVKGSVAKNGNDRICTIPNVMIDDVKEIMKLATNNSYYIFSKSFIPGKNRWDSREIARYWAHIREQLQLPKELQFYSLRDAGIIQKLRDGMDPVVVKELADHSSLEITNKYVKIARQKANQEAKEKSSRF